MMPADLVIRDAVPQDAPFLAECIMAGMHFCDFDEVLNDDMSDILDNLTRCEAREDVLYSWKHTRVAEVDGKAVGALLSYPGEVYRELRDRTFLEFWPAYFAEHSGDDPETDPGEYYLDSLAVLPDYRGKGIGRALMKDGIQKGIDMGFTKIALVADAEMPHLASLYATLGFVPEGHRHAFGTDFLRMTYRVMK